MLMVNCCRCAECVVCGFPPIQAWAVGRSTVPLRGSLPGSRQGTLNGSYLYRPVTVTADRGQDVVLGSILLLKAAFCVDNIGRASDM
jgi:hypothetical protein